MIKTIRIYGKERKLKDGRSYLVFSYVNSKGDWYDIKFKKTCNIVPKGIGYWLLTVDTKEVSLQTTKKPVTTNNTTFIPSPIMWIGDVSRLIKDEEYENMLYAAKEKAIEEAFD